MGGCRVLGGEREPVVLAGFGGLSFFWGEAILWVERGVLESIVSTRGLVGFNLS